MKSYIAAVMSVFLGCHVTPFMACDVSACDGDSVACVAGKAGCQPADTSVVLPAEGDLLFCVSPAANAITDVTAGIDSLLIDHVGVFAHIDGRASVIEALPGRGVCITPVDTFVARRISGDGTMAPVLVGRVTGSVDIGASLNEVLRFVGCGYDSLYLPGNREIYCSELVQLSYVDSLGRQVFGTVPMTFRDVSGHIPEMWTRFYARHGMEVPEGWPGSNPGEMSRRKNVRIVRRLW